MAPDPVRQLRDRGIQVTAQRIAVLRAVGRRPHASAEAIAAAVRHELGAISTQSVYDALAVLLTGGLVRRIQPAGSPARFEARVGDNHHHLICRVCGEVVDVECAVGTAPCLTAADDMGYEIEEAEVAYWGRCPRCRTDAARGARRARAGAIDAPHRPPRHPGSRSSPRGRTSSRSRSTRT